MVVGLGLSALLCLCGGVTLSHVPKASPHPVTHHATPSARRAGGPTTEPTTLPRPSPTPSPTPHLTRSITQVVTTFCTALASRDYQRAWQQYSRQLQQTHPQLETFAAWRKFARCSIPGQSRTKPGRSQRSARLCRRGVFRSVGDSGVMAPPMK
jgi:hypothetical protein